MSGMTDFIIHRGHKICVIEAKTYVGQRWLERERNGNTEIGTEYLEDFIKALQEKGYEVEVI